MEFIRNRSFKRMMLTFSAFVFFAGCTSGPSVYTNQDPSADFGQFKTYNYQETLGTDRPNEGARSLLSQYFITATDREMQARGYTKSDNPDLLLNYYLQTQEKIKSRQTPTTGGYYGYRGYGTWGGYAGTTTEVTQYTEGTLTLDMVEANRDQLVWEGTMVSRISSDVMENLQERADAAIVRMFQDFPYTAGSSVPRPTETK